MPGRGGVPLDWRHYTRTLEFGPDGSLYLSIGSRATDGVDPTPWRSAVKRYAPAVVAAWGGEPFHWQRGETWALGVRNSVGLRFDAAGTLWAVDNGQNYVVDADLGGTSRPTTRARKSTRCGRAGSFMATPTAGLNTSCPRRAPLCQAANTCGRRGRTAPSPSATSPSRNRGVKPPRRSSPPSRASPPTGRRSASTFSRARRRAPRAPATPFPPTGTGTCSCSPTARTTACRRSATRSRGCPWGRGGGTQTRRA
ncbi:hypothetical protein BU14_0074s0055 [Porphyra umbilicalis]|uniref:Pyrroloquinoline quinone-dependent pyranose dehydrogenase beta-propeller domain-containing protein n=1 Tax=Porphyra umbilicalis TaxID=2786 RepID=A0A1X6PFU4_PORUM|nr:hypothetical protein BU14_0074s0055 [Porphyra umbilicalis]|eukprot:OSX79625.1 hypothetical protein BU14_0074s0055 [Porphyra umbilicalis]